MKSEKRSQASLRKRKMLIVLPLLVIPFLTMAFWAMGGGKGKVQKKPAVQGLNLNLPDSKQKDDQFPDKLSFYDKADKDSARLAEWMRSDPYYKEKSNTEKPVNNDLEQLTQSTALKFNQRLNVSPFDKTKIQPEEKVMQKLSQLQKELDKNSNGNPEQEMYLNEKNQSSPEFSSEVDRLESMMNLMNKSNSDDPEIKQLNSTLEKILDIQHPERMKEKMKIPVTEMIFTVRNRADYDTTVNGFYSFESSAEIKKGNAIEAAVNENQVLVNGAVIKLRLLTTIDINNETIPAGSFVFGIVSLNGERLETEINSIRSDHSLYTVKMEVYDLDGLPGIYIPGAITRDVAKQSADNSLQTMELTTLDPSLKAQATATGVGMLKNLLSKKVKQVKVMVKAGYKVFLKNKDIF